MSGEILIQEHPERTTPTRRIQIVLRQPEVSNSAEESAYVIRKNTMNAEFSKLFFELEHMIGLERIKELIHEIYALLQITQFRAQAGLKSQAQVYHMVFKGNPGTGKTTVARLFARMFQSMGVLSKGHLVEVERADMVGEYIGHTAIKTRELMKKALGGILFIDEAYSLARGGEKDFGKEAIDCLVRGMENHKTDFILILAGYPDEMEQFLMMNPGLPSRFPIQVDFQDYTIEQLIQIAEIMAKEREYMWHANTLPKLRKLLLDEKQLCLGTFSNARYVRNIFEQSIRLHAMRLLQHYTASPSKVELMTIRPEDLRLHLKC
jgi:stage V sporulation protein K